jgi:protein-disulfide isomerase
MSRRAIVGLSLALAFAIFAATVLLYRADPVPAGGGKDRAPQSASASQEPPAPKDRSLLVRFHSPFFGNADAKVDLVEFFDPACGSCRAVYPLVRQIMDSHPGRIRLVIRYAPFHRGADEVVRLLEAARRQGKYQQTLETLLSAQGDWVINHTARPDLALKAVSAVGLDMNRLEEDMRSPQLKQLIEQDMRDAVALNVTGTPEFFINGAPLIPRDAEDLRRHVERAVRAAYP